MSDEISEYALFMKMLEIIEIRHRHSIEPPSEDARQRIVTVIEKIEGNLLLAQSSGEFIMNNEGDRFDNISNSVIATRGSIASGIIKVAAQDGPELADALKALDQAINASNGQVMPPEEKQKALALLDELTRQASSPNRAKVVLEAVGKGLWEAIKAVGPVSKVAHDVWPVVSKLWS
jgi:hypothetical protein